MKDEKASLILKAGKELFSKFGLRKTTVDEIAKKAGIAKGTIYLYHKSKEEIFTAIFNREIGTIRETIDAAVNAAQGAEDKFRAYITMRIKCLLKLATFYEPFTEEYFESYSFLENVRQGFNAYETGLIKSILELGVSQGRFVVKHLDLTAKELFTLVKGMELYLVREKDEKSIELRIAVMTDILFNGINRR